MMDFRRLSGGRRLTRISLGLQRYGLMGRRFRTRIVAPEGKNASGARGVSRGLPQGGVPSPLLWVLRFNRFFRLAEEWGMQETGRMRGGASKGDRVETAYL